MTKRKALGKGLSALIEENPNVEETGYIPDLPVEKIVPNPSQPRSEIKPEDLIGLADSIREHGIIEPLIVTEHEGKYQLIAGERRWRAAQLAQIEAVPVIIKEVTSQQILEMAIIENVQRQDLNPLEEAVAYQELMDTYDVKITDLAKKVGKDKSTISNKTRLLKLPKTVQEGILKEQITESHAYYLLGLKSKDALLAAYNIILKKGLSVRETMELVKKITVANKDVVSVSQKKQALFFDEKILKIEKDLSEKLGKGFKLTKKKKGKGGKITIPFVSDEQLEELYKFIMKQKIT